MVFRRGSVANGSYIILFTQYYFRLVTRMAVIYQQVVYISIFIEIIVKHLTFQQYHNL